MTISTTSDWFFRKDGHQLVDLLFCDQIKSQFSHFCRIFRLTNSILSPLNQLASGPENPCFLASETSLGIILFITSLKFVYHLESAEKLGLFNLIAFSFIRITSLKFLSFRDTGHFIANSVKSLSKNDSIF